MGGAVNKVTEFQGRGPGVIAALHGIREHAEAYSQNPKDDSCDGVDCGLEC